MVSPRSPNDVRRCRICFMSSCSSQPLSPNVKEQSQKSIFITFIISILARIFRSCSVVILKMALIFNNSLLSSNELITLELSTKNEVIMPGNELISPCSCSGSVGWVHRSCINHWRYSQLVSLILSYNNGIIFDSGLFAMYNTPRNDAIKSCINWGRWYECCRIRKVICNFFTFILPDSTFTPLIKMNQGATWFPFEPVQASLPSSFILSFETTHSLILLRDSILTLLGLNDLKEPLLDIEAIISYFFIKPDSNQIQTPFQTFLSFSSIPKASSPARIHPFLNCDLCRSAYIYKHTPVSPLISNSNHAVKIKKWSFLNSFLFLFLIVVFLIIFSGLSKFFSHYLQTNPHYCNILSNSRNESPGFVKDTINSLEELSSLFIKELSFDSYYPIIFPEYTKCVWENSSYSNPKSVVGNPNMAVFQSIYLSILSRGNIAPTNYSKGAFCSPSIFGIKTGMPSYTDHHNESDTNDHFESHADVNFFIEFFLQFIAFLFRGLVLLICAPPLLAFLFFKLISFFLPYSYLAILLAMQICSVVLVLIISRDYLFSLLTMANIISVCIFAVNNVVTISVGIIASIVGIVHVLYLSLYVSDTFIVSSSIQIPTQKSTEKESHLLNASRFYWNICTNEVKM